MFRFVAIYFFLNLTTPVEVMVKVYVILDHPSYTMISCDGELLIDWAVGLYLEIIIFVVHMLKLYAKVTGF